MDAVRLMLVDDHDVIRTGLKSFLQTQPGFQVVAEASTGNEALAQLQMSAPDVVVMDITMPDMDGMEATRRIKAMQTNCKVLVLTVHADEQYFFEMLAAGADGYVTKQAAAEELVEAIRAVAGGLVYLQPALASWLLKDYRRLLAQSPAHPAGEELSLDSSLGRLSKRELQVLECVAQGMTSIQIGEALEISPKTVARHRERIMGKLEMHSTTELVRFAIRTGLIDLND